MVLIELGHLIRILERVMQMIFKQTSGIDSLVTLDLNWDKGKTVQRDVCVHRATSIDEDLTSFRPVRPCVDIDHDNLNTTFMAIMTDE